MNDKLECPECGSKHIATDVKHGEQYCADCGVVIVENIVDLGPEWRSYDDDQAAKRIRTGPPMSYRIYDKGLSTYLSPSLCLSQKIRIKLIVNSKDISTMYAFNELDRIISTLNLSSSIKEEACLLYKKAQNLKILKGKGSIESLTAAIVYIVCRQNEIPRSLKEITSISKASLSIIRNNYRMLANHLNIKLKPIEATQYIPRFCSMLGIDNGTASRAIQIAMSTKGEVSKKGWNPIIVAGACIYLADDGKTCKLSDICKVTFISEVSIRNRVEELAKYVEK